MSRNQKSIQSAIHFLLALVGAVLVIVIQWVAPVLWSGGLGIVTLVALVVGFLVLSDRLVSFEGGAREQL